MPTAPIQRQPIAPLDLGLKLVTDFFQAIPNLSYRIGNALRQAFDEVIDGPRTGRYCIEQLEKTEKTYIGTKVEIVLRVELDLQRGLVLDNLIGGYEVDTKFSLTGNWMIPREAVGHLCLLVRGSDTSGLFGVGLLRTTPEMLTSGVNQDGKATVSAFGKRHIIWLIKDAAMVRNFVLDLDDATRLAILSPNSGKQRLLSLFRNVNDAIIPRSAILQVAQLKGDPLKRAREAKATLLKEGIRVLCATYLEERELMKSFGVGTPKDDDWLSIRI